MASPVSLLRTCSPEGEEGELGVGGATSWVSPNVQTSSLGFGEAFVSLGPWCCCPHSLVSAEANSVPAPRSPQLSHACVVCSSGFTIFLTILICPSEDHARAIDPVL